MERTAAILVAIALGLGTATAPAAAAAPTPAAVAVSVRTAQVDYPKAVPGRFCKKEHRNDWTRTKKYGKVKCIDKNGWRWVRSK